MLRRTRQLADGKQWVGYYYNGRDSEGKRIEIPLGSDLHEAKRKWAELECKPAPVDTRLMHHVFNRYEAEIIPQKAPRTQKDNFDSLRQLRKIFDSAPIDAITPQHIAQYRDHRQAKVRANRELALLSHIFNMGREWGYTSKENPVKGVRKNKETPRDFYADDEVWQAVYAHAGEELKDALDIAYYTGQRQADVLKMRETDIRNGALEVRQNKTGKKLLIQLDDEDGYRSELGKVIDRLRARNRKIHSLFLVATPSGQPLSLAMLRLRFEAARKAAIEDALPELAERIRRFQFRDTRAKAASDIKDINEASKLLGHSEKKLTRDVYRRVGEKVKPTK